MLVQLGVLAALAIVCLVSFAIESRRARQWQIDGGKTVPKSVKKLFPVGNGPWVLLGTSTETSFEHVSSTPTLESEAFELQDEAGAVFKVPRGSKIEIRGIDGARRSPLDAITTGGRVKPRFTFEVAPDKPLYTLDPKSKRLLSTMYRGSDTEVLGGAGKTVIFAGDVGRLAGSVAPGCWLAILGPVLGVGAILAVLGATDFAWAAAGIAGFFVVVGWIAFPERPPDESRGQDRKS